MSGVFWTLLALAGRNLPFSLCFGMALAASEYVGERGASFLKVVAKLDFAKGITPEKAGAVLGFLVPPKTREKCFKPFFEDLKADRLERIARTSSRGVKRWIEFCFYLRLAVTVVQALACYLDDLLAKIAPFVRALFFKGGS